MTPLVFIIIVVTMLTLLVYWVLSTVKESKPTPLRPDHFKYEFARDLTMQGEAELFLPPDTIRLSGDHASYVFAYWNLSKEKWGAAVEEYALSAPAIDRLFVRLYEATEWLKYYDIHARSIAGKCRLELQPDVPYYAVLGVKSRSRFIPLLTSATVQKPR
jgi:hypothetical protein